MDNKYIIGLTGNIATGKSLVLRMLKEVGADTLDADDLVHILMRREHNYALCPGLRRLAGSEGNAPAQTAAGKIDCPDTAHDL